MNGTENSGLAVVANSADGAECAPFVTIEIDGPLLERVRVFHAASREWKEQPIESFCAWLVRRGLSTEINDLHFHERLRPGGRECA